MKFHTALGAMAGVYLLQLVLIETVDIYSMFPNFDIPMHIAGGFVAAMLGIAIHQHLGGHKISKASPAAYHAMFILGAVMLIAVAWEFHEFALDWVNQGRVDWRMMQPSMADTMMDLLMGMIGGAAAIIVFRKEI